MRSPLIKQLHSLAVTMPCGVVTASYLNRAFRETFSIRCRLHYNLIKVCEKVQMSKRIFKRLTLAQCIYVQCRPTVEGRRPLHSVYLHTLFMCIAPWQSGAYALERSALYPGLVAFVDTRPGNEVGNASEPRWPPQTM